MPSKASVICIALAQLILSTAAAQAPVQVATAERRDIVEKIAVTGTVTSPRTAVLSTAVAGLVVHLSVDEGDRAEAGDILLELDAELADLARQRALAEVRQRRTALADAQRRLDEAERVGPERGVARTQIESLRAEVRIGQAALAAAEAAVREQAAIVERHRLKAPFAGVVSQRLSELGEWVNPGDGLLELVATEGLRFDFRVAQNFFGELHANTPVEITVDALPGRSFEGRVQAIVPIKDPAARTFLLRVVVGDDAETGSITPGMSARATLSLATGRDGIAISRDAILRYPDGRLTLWLAETRDGVTIVRERIVATGLEFDGLVEVKRGLEAGEVVVTRGNESLQEEQVVTILDGDT